MEETHIVPLLKQIHFIAQGHVNSLLKNKDLTLAQAHVLGFLYMSEDNTASLKILEEHLRVAQSTSAGIVQRLEKKEFIKTFSSPKDKRIKMAKLTETGKATFDQIKEIFPVVENEIFGSLSQGEKTLFLELLNKIIDADKQRTLLK